MKRAFAIHRLFYSLALIGTLIPALVTGTN